MFLIYVNVGICVFTLNESVNGIVFRDENLSLTHTLTQINIRLHMFECCTNRRQTKGVETRSIIIRQNSIKQHTVSGKFSHIVRSKATNRIPITSD